MRNVQNDRQTRGVRVVRYWPFLLLIAVSHCNQVADIDSGLPLLDARCAGLAEGAVLSNQVDGDCATLICDGEGHVELVPDTDDVPDDGDPCTDGQCDGTFGWQSPRDWGICYTGPEGTENVGICRPGVFDCRGPRPPEGECLNEVRPGTEVCDILHLDENCDGQVDDVGGPGCSCGDGFVQVADGEECDDKNEDPSDGCTPNCKKPRCGDGFLDHSTGENCDNGDENDALNCPMDCRFRATQLATGSDHTCALFANGRIKCWGANFGGQLGLGDAEARGNEPGEMRKNLPWVDLGKSRKAIAISAGDLHTCAILEGGAVKCWGYNGLGQLGVGDTVDRGYLPTQMGDALPTIDLGTGIAAVAIKAGGTHTCVLLSNGGVKCWGANWAGQLGLGDTVHRGGLPNDMGDALPFLNLGTGQVAKQVYAGAGHTCVLLTSGNVKCWGDNFQGQLGLGDETARGDEPDEMGDNLPFVNLGAGTTATTLSIGGYHTCALLSTNKLKCWGLNGEGQLGLGDSTSRGSKPNDMQNLPTIDLGSDADVTGVAAGLVHTCAVLKSGQIKCWGGGFGGAIGLETYSRIGDGPLEMGNNLPSVNLGTGAAVEFLDNAYHNCAWLSGGAIKCWGFNTSGQLGLGDFRDRGVAAGDMGDNLPFVEPL